jgi:hypothetical protein
MAAMYRIASGEAPPLAGADPNLSPAAAAFVACCCAQDPAARPGAARLLATHPWLQPPLESDGAAAAATVPAAATNVPAVAATARAATRVAAATRAATPGGHGGDDVERASETGEGAALLLGVAVRPSPSLRRGGSPVGRDPAGGDDAVDDDGDAAACDVPDPAGSPFAHDALRPGGHDRRSSSSLREPALSATAQETVGGQYPRSGSRNRIKKGRNGSNSRRSGSGSRRIGSSGEAEYRCRGAVTGDGSNGSKSGDVGSGSNGGLSLNLSGGTVEAAAEAASADGAAIAAGVAAERRPRASKGRRSRGQGGQGGGHGTANGVLERAGSEATGCCCDDDAVSGHRPPHPTAKARPPALGTAEPLLALATPRGAGAAAAEDASEGLAGLGAAAAAADNDAEQRRLPRRRGRGVGGEPYQSKTPGAKEHRLFAPERTQTTLEFTFTAQQSGRDSNVGDGCGDGNSNGGGNGSCGGSGGSGGAADCFARPSGAASGQLRKLDLLLSQRGAATLGSGHAARQAATAELLLGGGHHGQQLDFHDQARYSKSAGYAHGAHALQAAAAPHANRLTSSFLPPLLDGAAGAAAAAPLNSLQLGGSVGGGMFSRARLSQRHVASAPSALGHGGYGSSSVHVSLQALPGGGSGTLLTRLAALGPLRNSTPAALNSALPEKLPGK